jgi:hypothetical protein
MYKKTTKSLENMYLSSKPLQYEKKTGRSFPSICDRKEKAKDVRYFTEIGK